MKKLAATAGVAPLYALVGSGVAAFLVVFLMGGMQFISNLVGFGPPAYSSFKALATPDTEDDTLWLSYWVVFCFLTLLEGAFGLTIASFIPFYWFIKTAFLTWCHSILGPKRCYELIVRPVMLLLQFQERKLLASKDEKDE